MLVQDIRSIRDANNQHEERVASRHRALTSGECVGQAGEERQCMESRIKK